VGGRGRKRIFLFLSRPRGRRKRLKRFSGLRSEKLRKIPNAWDEYEGGRGKGRGGHGITFAFIFRPVGGGGKECKGPGAVSLLTFVGRKKEGGKKECWQLPEGKKLFLGLMFFSGGGGMNQDHCNQAIETKKGKKRGKGKGGSGGAPLLILSLPKKKGGIPL